MECSEPGALRDEELVAYLAGQAVRPAVVQHLAHCQHCALQLATYRHIELDMLSKLYRWDCPPNQVLGEFQLGMLSQAQASAVKSHLKRCLLCTAEVATLTEFLAHEPVLAQPVPVVQRGVSAGNNHHPVQDAKRRLEQLREQSLAGARRIAATLVPQQPRLAFQRNASAQSVLWPRRYMAENVTVTVQVERDPDQKDAVQLIGFVTQKGAAIGSLRGTVVQLSIAEADAKAIYTQTIDDLGNFVFAALAPADYTLELQLPAGIVVIDQLAVAVQE
jgi:hypothetical protein